MQHAAERHQVDRVLQDLLTRDVIPASRQIDISVRLSSHTMLLITTVDPVLFVEDAPADRFGVIDFDGTVLEGELNSTAAPMIALHAAIYAANSGLGAVIHAHPASVTSCAVANQPLPTQYLPLLLAGQYDDIPVVPGSVPGSTSCADALATLAATRPGTCAALMTDHSVTAFHSTLSRAVRVLSALEEAAAGEIRTAKLPATIPEPQLNP
ncbi:class II aldolase/adducin family protein [Nocardia sp. NPDC051030]|uniref:class II aldolase/adducin family protein n=1 Tax=Nocardia sp. NPDC051030 TaxID=3155162 RepID=UPI00341D9006